MDEGKPNDNSPIGDNVIDLRPQPTSQKKPDMRFDPSTFGHSDLASKLPSFLEELARANRETEAMMAANPKAARIEIDDDEEEGVGDKPVIEMNLYSGILESEEPNDKKKKKEIVMPDGQPLAGGDGGAGDSDGEPFISEPVKVRHTSVNDRKRRASTSSSDSAASSASSSSSEGETRVIKLPILVHREGSPESQASEDSAEHTGSFSRKEVPPKKKFPTKKGDGSLPSSSLKDQDVQDWVDSQPSTTGEYDEIEGAPKRKMLIPHTRVGSKQSRKNVQNWVNNQANHHADHQ